LRSLKKKYKSLHSHIFIQFCSSCQGVMSFDSFGRKTIVHYSPNLERATLFDQSPTNDQMPPRRRRRGTSSKRRGARKLKGGHRVNKGRISVRLAGYGLQKLPASQLIRFVSLKNIKTAAKKILSKTGGSLRKRAGGRRRKGRKRGVGKRRRRSRRRL